MAILKCRNRSQRLTLCSAIAIAALLSGSVLRACPFCLSPPMTLVKEIANTDIVVIVELLRFEVVVSGERRIPQSTVRIREFLQGAELSEIGRASCRERV